MQIVIDILILTLYIALAYHIYKGFKVIDKFIVKLQEDIHSSQKRQNRLILLQDIQIEALNTKIDSSIKTVPLKSKRERK